MKVKYLLLLKRLNLPGIGLGPGQRLSANGLDSLHTGCVKAIWPIAGGYRVYVPAGAHRGYYDIPGQQVDHAFVELAPGDEALMKQALVDHETEIAEAKKLAEDKAAEDAAKLAPTGAATGAATKPQRKPKPTTA